MRLRWTVKQGGAALLRWLMTATVYLFDCSTPPILFSMLASLFRRFTEPLLLLCFLGSAVAGEKSSQWWVEIPDETAKNPSTLGFWRFATETTLSEDQSSHNHKGTIKGAKWSATGKFGGNIEGGAGYPVDDKPHGLWVKRSPVLSPSGAFTLEMWIRPNDAEAFPPEMGPVLVDSKYTPDNHTGLMWSLGKEGSAGKRNFRLDVGLGTRTEAWFSEPVSLKAGEWHHIGFSYDAQGTVTFFRNGTTVGISKSEGVGAMAPAVRDFCIGDRIGSLYRGFPGGIDEVLLSEGLREYRPLKVVSDASRPVFRRFAKDSKLALKFSNLTSTPLESLSVSVTVPDNPPYDAKAFSEIDKEEVHEMSIPLDTSLRPGEYEAEISVTSPGWGEEGQPSVTTTKIPFVIVPRPLPHRMPVVMWGLGGTDGVVGEIPRLTDLGFTHCLGLRADYQKIWDEGASALPGTEESIDEGREMLDRAFENDIKIVSSLSPGRWLRSAKVGEPFLRINRKGEHYKREDVSASFPRFQQFAHDTGAAMSRAYGDHPAFASALLHTEVRGESQVSFHPEEIEAARKAIGTSIPEAVTIKNGVEYGKLPEFPKDRVISDSDPILKYLEWFWTKGDGWNDLSTKLNDGLKSEMKHRDDFWTFHDPAVRVPSIRGSGGNADVLGHWTYSYPDPIRIGMCTDQLFEMARVNDTGQDIMKMTQVIWYRSQTAPTKRASEGDSSPWVDQDPDAAYITIAPMHLREAFWWKMSRPIRGIMYHGWQSLVKNDSAGAYRFTNGNTAGELKRLVKEVVEPLGPTLMQVPDAPSDVAFLESFTSQMFARRGNYGWNRGWTGDFYQVLMYAQLQPRVMYEESLLKGNGLDGVKVLVMADCDVLTESVVAKVNAFQKAGGLVIGDAEVCPAIKVDILIPRSKRTKEAAADRAALLKMAGDLVVQLEGKYKWPLASVNRDVVTRRRVSGSSDYVFAVNDKREAGSYVGNYGMVMENGLPSETTVVLNRAKGFVYDLLSQQQVTAVKEEAGALNIPVSLGPCEGRVFLVTESAIDCVHLAAPEFTKKGKSVEIEVSVLDAEGKAIDAVVPIDLRIVDPEGVEMERSGYYGAQGGVVKIKLDIASNDPAGLWEIRATEGAAGNEARAYLRVGEEGE